ncbi:MAG: peptide deformylase [Clostridia bacterium]|nr:peptide deformylase [Clostridia bacterium]
MAILNILKEGDPTLRKKCRPVGEISARTIRLIDDMRDTLKKSGGVGLAAPQVGVLRRIVLVENEKGEVLELINPEIIDTDGEQEGLEGCLSLPDKWGIVTRPYTVTVRALDRNGKEYTYTGTELTARCFCHELDHLDGVLYIDRAERMLTPEELEELTGE